MEKNNSNKSKTVAVLAYSFTLAVICGVVAGVFNVEWLGIICAVVMAIVLLVVIVASIFDIKL